MALLRTSRQPVTRLDKARDHLERTAQALPITLPRSLPGLTRAQAPRATSIWSTGSRWSAGSLGSLLCFASVGSLLSAGSVLSIGSAGSILSIGSVGSVLSIGSAGSILSIGGAGRTPSATEGSGVSGATELVRRAGTVAGVCAVVAALAS